MRDGGCPDACETGGIGVSSGVGARAGPLPAHSPEAQMSIATPGRDAEIAVSTAASARPLSIESRASWVVAVTVLGLMSISFGAPLVGVVGLQPIAQALGGERSVPALAGALAWFGSAVGGIVMGRIADRIGVRWTVMFGASMIGAGLAVSTLGGPLALYLGHGLFMGLLGNAGINAPLYVYVSRWFDRRRGTALALISSGQYIAGVLWPAIFAHGIAELGWRQTMILFGILEVAIVVPVAGLVLRAPPDTAPLGTAAAGPMAGKPVLGLNPNVVLALLAAAGFMCCLPMAMPQAHLVAFCGDVGISPSRGALMLSLLLACAFVSRQVWGLISDRIGGLRTVLAASACQAVAMAAFLATQDEVGLFLVSAGFGFGFSGVIPAYILAIRDLFPAAEAGRRIPTFLVFSGSGMAAGGWLAGAIYDRVGFYAPAFATGLAVNLLNLAVVGYLVVRQGRRRHRFL